jgi:hypothetical protein
VLAEELLARLRVGIGHEVEYAEPPVHLGGGFFNANYRFSLKGCPAGWSCPMVFAAVPEPRARNDQFVTRGPEAREFALRGTSATSLAAPEPFAALLDGGPEQVTK